MRAVGLFFMPTTTITEASFQTACAECADAIIAGAWDTAWQKLGVAEAINTGLLARLTVGSMDKTRRESLTGLAARIVQLEGRGNRGSDNRRLISTQMGFGGGGQSNG